MFLVELTFPVLEKLGDSAWATVAATVVIAAFTGTLWWSTHKLWKAGERQIVIAQKLADAAKASADASIALERPRLFIGRTFIKMGEIDPITGRATTICDYSIENCGRTPAILDAFCVELRCLQSLPSQPIYEQIIPSRGRVIYHTHPADDFRTELRQTEQHHITNGELTPGFTLYLFGFFEYGDVFGASITTGFCYRASPLTGRLLKEGGNAYNYDRREN